MVPTLCICIDVWLCQVLRTWGQRSLASSINNAGKKLLQPNNADVGTTAEIAVEASVELEPAEGEEPISQSGVKKRKKSRKAQAQQTFGDSDGSHNEELRALEAYMLRATKQREWCSLQLSWCALTFKSSSLCNCRPCLLISHSCYQIVMMGQHSPESIHTV